MISRCLNRKVNITPGTTTKFYHSSNAIYHNAAAAADGKTTKVYKPPSSNQQRKHARQEPNHNIHLSTPFQKAPSSLFKLQSS